jgi:hypothetical protein
MKQAQLFTLLKRGKLGLKEVESLPRSQCYSTRYSNLNTIAPEHLSLATIAFHICDPKNLLTLTIWRDVCRYLKTEADMGGLQSLSAIKSPEAQS